MAPKSQNSPQGTHTSIISHFFIKVKHFVQENPIHTLIGLLVVIFAGIIIFSISAMYLNTPYKGEQATIVNLSDYTKGKPTDHDTLEYIKHDLYRVISYNLPATDEAGNTITDSTGTLITNPTALTDIAIRDGTFSQEHDETNDIYTVTFLVDIPSLYQTYRVSYQWSPTHPNSEHLDEYGTIVTCPLASELIYADFHCQDSLTRESAGTDPITAHLPYSSKYFDIALITTTQNDTTPNTTSTENTIPNTTPTNQDASPVPDSTTDAPTKPQLLVTLYVYLYETDYDARDSAAEAIKPAVLHWLSSQGFDPTNYDLIYQLEVI